MRGITKTKTGRYRAHVYIPVAKRDDTGREDLCKTFDTLEEAQEWRRQYMEVSPEERRKTIDEAAEKGKKARVDKDEWCGDCFYNTGNKGAAWCDYWEITGTMRSTICDPGEDCHRKGVYRKR